MVRGADTGPAVRGAPLDIVIGQKEAVALWMLQFLPDVTELPGGYEAIGVSRNSEIVGGCIFTEFRPCKDGGDIRVIAVGRGWLSRRTIAAMFGYVFNQLHCHRMTAAVAKGNKPSRRLLEKLGFHEEGKLRRGYDARQDLIVYGLLKSEQGWI